MEQGAERPLPHLVLQDRGGVVLRLAGMDDDRQAELARKRDLAAEHALGDVGRGVIVVVVEAGLADPDAFGMLGEPAHGGEIRRRLARRLVRMGSDGEEDAVVALGDLGEPRRLVDPRADGDHPLDARRRARALDDRVEFVGEIGKIEMAMAVDQRHVAASGST